MIPQPMPVPSLTKRKSSTLRAVPAWSSPSAMMFTSLSTMTGAPRAAARVSRTGNPFQPGMIGGILEHHLRAAPHVGRDPGVREQAQLAVRDGYVDGGRADVDAHEAQGFGETDEVRAAAATGLR